MDRPSRLCCRSELRVVLFVLRRQRMYVCDSLSFALFDSAPDTNASIAWSYIKRYPLCAACQAAVERGPRARRVGSAKCHRGMFCSIFFCFSVVGASSAVC